MNTEKPADPTAARALLAASGSDREALAGQAPDLLPETGAEVGEMPVDELEDGEELVTEIPVHGVATVEGRATGDGRGFRLNALDLGAMPQPLGYEYVSTHGGDTSNVAIVGRIDSYERKELEDGVVELRWRGVVMPGKEYGARAIEAIVDGSYTGLSVIVDSVVVDVEDEKEAFRARLRAEQNAELGAEQEAEGDAAPKVRSDEEIEALVDDFIGDGTQPVTWFSSARVRRFDMVPTGAFQEAFIALGHEFDDELTEEQVTAAAQALEDCGCGQDVRASAGGTIIIDLSGLSEEQVAEYDALSNEEQDAYAAEHGLVIFSTVPFREVSQEERDRLAKENKAMPDGSYPVANVDDLRNAIQAIGRADDPEAVKRFLERRAKELGQEGLIPEDWGAEVVVASAFAPTTHDGPGWVTHPIPTQRLRNYWTKGEGAAEIAWGTPGSFNRCRSRLAKYVQNPDWLAGLCANMYKEATGRWPGRQRGDKGLTASAGAPAPLAVIASADSSLYPASAFAEPTEDRAYAMRIDKQARTISGYAAQWGTCHIGISGMCQQAPHSSTDYSYFRKGVVDTDAGEQRVALITSGIGHASEYASAAAATAHYDQTDAVRAYINIGENDKGIWYAGVIAPGVSDAQIDEMRAIGRVSGDWRNWSGRLDDLEMVGLVCVNTEGFQLAASGGVQTVAIGIGALSRGQGDDPVALAASGEIQELAAEVVEFDTDALAEAVAEKIVKIQDRQALAAQARPARAALAAHVLAGARAKLAEITKE